MTKLQLVRTGIAAAGAMLFSTGVLAQEAIPVDLPQEVNQVGVGAFAVPDFYGGDRYHAEGGGFLHANFGNGMWIEVLGRDLKVNLVPTELGQNVPQLSPLRAGFVWRSRPSRSNDTHEPTMRLMRPIATASELGVFASYDVPLPGDPLHKIVLSGDAAWNTNTVYSGAVGNIRATYFYPIPQRVAGLSFLGSLGVSLFFASDHFNNRYFGINNEDVALFPELGGVPYRAEGGLTSIRVPFQITSQIYRNVSVTLAGRYERLLDDAADSPIVRNHGNENQWIGGVTVNYLF